MTGRVDGKVALITGGGSGIGAATATLLAAEGAAVGVADLIGDRAADVAAAIAANGGRAIPIEADVSDERAVHAMVDAVVNEFGRLDVLHNNAALVDPHFFPRDGAVADMDLDVWERVMAVNLRGPMLGCKYAVPHMLAAGGGSIINMSSGSSRTSVTSRAPCTACRRRG